MTASSLYSRMSVATSFAKVRASFLRASTASGARAGSRLASEVAGSPGCGLAGAAAGAIAGLGGAGVVQGRREEVRPVRALRPSPQPGHAPHSGLRGDVGEHGFVQRELARVSHACRRDQARSGEWLYYLQ